MNAVRDALGALFRSPVGRRALALFAVSAVVPTTILAALSLQSVTGQLDEAADDELHRTAKAVGMGLAERLGTLADDLALAEVLLTTPDAHTAADGAAVAARLARRFDALAVVDGGVTRRLLGAPPALAPLDTEGAAHLTRADCLVQSDAAGRVRLIRRGAAGGLLVGAPTADALWGSEAARIPIGATWIVDAAGRALFADGALPLPEVRTGRASRAIAFHDASGAPWVGTARELFLVPAYGVRWTVVHARPRELLLAPLRQFRSIYLSTLALALVAVVAVSVVQIRRTLEPIERLRFATRRIADGDLEVRVGCERRDEFGELARSFDAMTARLVENIRRREATERDLVRARDEALAAARAEAAFLTNVSHEFRTPLTGIQGSAEILRDFVEEPAEVRQEFVATIVDQAAHLARLVDDVIAMSGLDASRLEFDDAPVPLVASVLAAVGRLPIADVGRVRVEVEDESVAVRGAARWLESLWARLVENACKFSDGEVLVRVLCDPDQVVVEVVDGGTGIDPADHEVIFERFRQVGRDQLTDKAGGTGLGLALAREIAQQHGGAITVDSELGSGATFRVALPRLGTAAAICA